MRAAVVSSSRENEPAATKPGQGPPASLARARTAADASGAAHVTEPNGRDGEADPLVGQLVADRYQVLGVLGRGGMGTVYLCEHVQLKKRMALKVLAEELRRQPTLVARFLKEARAAAQIGHPNIVDVYDLGELKEGGAYIAMARLEGEDLQSELQRTGTIAFPRARAIVGKICRALAAAHGKGIVHRDLKPANVFLARDEDGGEQVKVLDFGIAQVNELSGDDAARLTQTGSIVGTPAFMSPEQGRGQRADHRTDIYSVGCILYTLLTGQAPFDAETLMGVISKHLFDPAPAPSVLAPAGSVTPEIDALVQRAMAKDPADRFQTMKELWNALEACGDDPAAWPDASSGRFERLGRTPAPGAVRPIGAGRPAALVAGMLLLAGGGAVFALWPRASAPRSAPAPAVVAAAAPVPVPVEVTIEVRSTPPGAAVLEGERVLGATPLKLVRARAAGALALRVVADGSVAETLSLPLDRDRAARRASRRRCRRRRRGARARPRRARARA